MVSTDSMDKIMAAVAFLGMIELFFTLIVALACWIVLVGCGILSETTTALQIGENTRKAGLVRQDV